MARRRRRSRTRVSFYVVLFALLFVIWLVSIALAYWYFTLLILGAVVATFYWWRQRGKRATERAQRERDAAWEASRQEWRELTWDDGPYSVVVSGFDGLGDAERVIELLADTPAFREEEDPEQAADELVERVEHIAPQTVAEGITQRDAVHLKQALESRGAKVKIAQTVRARRSSGGREPIPESVRHEVWRRDGGQCVDCGSRERLEFDHIIPLAENGSNTARNIELRCESCNRKKGAKI